MDRMRVWIGSTQGTGAEWVWLEMDAVRIWEVGGNCWMKGEALSLLNKDAVNSRRYENM